MAHLADTTRLVQDGILTTGQADEIRNRSRETMITLAINIFLTGGIIAATLGFIGWLADPVPVAALGGLSLLAGLFQLLKGDDRFAIFGNAAALIGAGLLIGGASVELMANFEAVAPTAMALLGGLVLVVAGAAFRRAGSGLGLLTGAIALMGAAAHLTGLALFEFDGLAVTGFFLYAAALIFALGVLVDVRFVTALAIIPFAQMLDTSTLYWHAAYAFYSPESTLSIIQMGVLVATFTWLAARLSDRVGRHFGITAMLAFVVMNLCFLVGSLWGDEVGQSIWGPDRTAFGRDWEGYQAALEDWRNAAWVIGEQVYSIIWAAVLIGLTAFSALTTRRGLFNASLTFLGIHLYTQMFESYGDEPMAWALGGLAAIPAAWGLMLANSWIKTRQG